MARIIICLSASIVCVRFLCCCARAHKTRLLLLAHAKPGKTRKKEEKEDIHYQLREKGMATTAWRRRRFPAFAKKKKASSPKAVFIITRIAPDVLAYAAYLRLPCYRLAAENFPGDITHLVMSVIDDGGSVKKPSSSSIKKRKEKLESENGMAAAPGYLPAEKKRKERRKRFLSKPHSLPPLLL